MIMVVVQHFYSFSLTKHGQWFPDSCLGDRGCWEGREEFIGILNSVGPDPTAPLGFNCLCGPLHTLMFEIIKHLLSAIFLFTEG